MWTYACGDGATEPPAPTPDPPRATTLTVTPATLQLVALGATEQLTAEVRDQNGNAMAGATVSWSSNATAVATVDANGLVMAAGNGTATITATAGSASGSAQVTVAQEVSAVAVTPPADTLVVGDTLRLTAEAADANGHAVAGADFAWASQDTLVAVVDSAGLVTGIAARDVVVTATSSGVTGSTALTVVAPVPTTVAVTPDTVALTAIAQTAQLAAEVRDQAGRPMADAAVAWSSADTLVAAVDSAGLVTAVGGGSVTVTASAGEASGEALVTVMQSAGSVVVSPAADTVAPGDTLRLVAEAFDENGYGVEGSEFDWSSSNPSVATVDDSGLVRGQAKGKATITAASGDVHGTSEMTVANPDRAALVALYEASDGPNWVNNENWLTEAPLGEWYGVGTDGAGRVVSLDLSGRWDDETQEVIRHGLRGTIPTELGALIKLRTLVLSRNELTGPIPSELGNLSNLTTLDLDNNTLSGPIPPELANLANLSVLRAGQNRLSGPIPSDLAKLANLTFMWLWSNELAGPIPPELGGLANLGYLHLGSNELTGPIPAELGNLSELATLLLYTNGLSGPIPPEVGNLANLRNLYLQRNDLTGPIPQSILRLDNLQRFYIRRNEDLCVPGSSAFVAWLRGIEYRDPDSETVLCNAADVAALKQLYLAAGGRDWTESTGWPGDGAVEEWHGVSADSLGQVTALDLSRNGLAGRLPHGLDAMAQMTELRVGGNPGLSGRLPLSLARLSLRTLHYSGTDLCAPAEPSFRAWLSAIPSHEGTGAECPPLSEREVLGELYRATGGPEWNDSENWLTDAPLGDWWGVSVNGQGQVVELKLGGNNLQGAIPPELSALSKLERLQLWTNSLVGPIPPQLGDLTKLRGLSLGFNDLTGSIPPELGRLSELQVLSIQVADLSGPIPAELGSLSSLQHLLLSSNRLTGSIPPALASLSSLSSLSLRSNDLTGSIPSVLADLPRLQTLSLEKNSLTGPIPPGLGSLSNLRRLDLEQNQLTGPIPPELGSLPILRELRLSDNGLTGPVPPELGDLFNLEVLRAFDNRLSGPLPPELGRLAMLQELSVSGNAEMAGALPDALTALRRLESLLAAGTDLCAPSDPGFQSWLAGVVKRRIAPCAEGGPPAAYLTQAVQSREFPVPLVAGEEALLRVFVTADRATSAGIPPVRARFYRNGGETHVVEIPGQPEPIPMEVDESSLAKSANAEIPANVVQPGLEMVIEVDPDGTLDPGLGVPQRIPETGRLSVDVMEMPVFHLTVIPFLWGPKPDSLVLEKSGAMAEDPHGHALLGMTRNLLPVEGFVVAAHEPVVTSRNKPFDLVDEVEAIRVLEGGRGYYLGTMTGEYQEPAGVAFTPGRASFSMLDQGSRSEYVIAHELGHNMSLQHPEGCQAGNPDYSYPYEGGLIGVWGYDFGAQLLLPPTTGDLMAYCPASEWISDYHFTNALRYRLSDEGPPAAVAAAHRSLLLWGGVSADAEPYLEPTFVVEAPAALPDSAGEYQISGRTETGTLLFALRFAMPETADGDGRASFAFVLPVRTGWAGNLARITLTGPGGSFTLDGDTDYPMAILRNAQNGQIRGILRDPPPATQAAADAVGQGAGTRIEMLFSRGIPDAEAWRR